jgi:hypothetical protein
MFGWVGLLFRIQSPLYRQYRTIADKGSQSDVNEFLDSLPMEQVEKLAQECLLEMEDELQQMMAAKARAEIEDRMLRLGFGDN